MDVRERAARMMNISPIGPIRPIFKVLRSEALSKASSLTSGDQSALEPPGPIPNPEVKRRSADGSGTIGPVRVGRRQVFAPHLRKKVRGSFLYFFREKSCSNPVRIPCVKLSAAGFSLFPVQSFL